MSRKLLYIIPDAAASGDGAMARPIKVVTADKGVRAELERRAKAPTSAYRDRLRAKIVLLRLDGLKNEDVAARGVDRETPKDLDLHLIADNYGTHKHPKVMAWLARHPRFRRSSKRSAAPARPS